MWSCLCFRTMATGKFLILIGWNWNVLILRLRNYVLMFQIENDINITNMGRWMTDM